jgi:tetratricopeptide (TPR) repeat protein
MAPIVAHDDLPAAGAMLAEALRIRRAVLPPQHTDIAQSLAALAQYERRRGQFETTRRLYGEALAIGRAGEPHSPRLVGLLNDYATFLGSMGADADAEPIQREAIALGLRVLGPNSLPLANLVNNLGVTLTRLGRLRDAELAFREGFDRHVATVGDRHWRTRNAARNVGRILALQQRYDESLTWMDRAIAVPIGADPARDAGLLSIVSQRAVIVFRLGRREEALRELTRAAARLATMSVAEADDVRAANSLMLARALNDTGQPVEAEARLAATAAWYEQFAGDHPMRAEAECERARARVLQGFVDEGRARLDRCLPIYRRWGLAERETVAVLSALLARRPLSGRSAPSS